MKIRFGLLPRVIVAIALGVGCGLFFPEWAVRVAITFNGIFNNFLNFIVPLLIFGLVVPGIADLGWGAGRLLTLTGALAYGFMLFSGFGTFFAGSAFLPRLIESGQVTGFTADAQAATPYFTVEMPPLMEVMTALVLAFVVGLGMAYTNSVRLREAAEEFRNMIDLIISRAIVPILPFYIFGIFLSMTHAGQEAEVLGVFVGLVVAIFVLTVVLLVVQFSIAGIVARHNPLRMLRMMLPAYATALGMQSSAATIPVTLACAERIGVQPKVAGFVIPLCATIHLSGSTMKVVACSMAVMLMTGTMPTLGLYAGFVLLLGITMIAAPGVPGGPIMAAVGLLESMLGFDQTLVGLMIATYIAMGSFGTATNVTGDGAVAVIVDRIERRSEYKRK